MAPRMSVAAAASSSSWWISCFFVMNQSWRKQREERTKGRRNLPEVVDPFKLHKTPRKEKCLVLPILDFRRRILSGI